MKQYASNYKVDSKLIAQKLALLVIEENIKILLTKTKKCVIKNTKVKH